MKNESYEKPAPEANEVSRYVLLRTCLDPESEEWNQTTMQKKIDILKKFITKGHSLEELVIDYRSYYIAEKKIEVAHRALDGVTELLNHLIKDKLNYQVIVER
ncbi:MAG TPA: hypothetical protein VFG54_03190 [Prolixibacteraceae bacterium]|nr:hypothetical protein [Prolixibacteraceae bacterium]